MAQPFPPEPLLDMNGLADLLNMSREWVRKQVQARAIPHHRFGRLIRFDAADVTAIMAAGAQPAMTTKPRLRMVPGPPSPPPPTPPPPPGPSTPPPPSGPPRRAARQAA